MLLIVAGAVGVPLAFLYLATRGRKPRVDVSVLRLAVDARARRALQAELQRIAGMARTSDAGGLLSMLRQVSIKLRACREAWTYAGVVDTRPMKPEQAQAFFQAQVQQARAVFQHELVRAADGAVSTAAAPPDLRARPEEGAGLVVITIAVAARVKIANFGDLPETEDVRRWLEAVRQIKSHDLVAVEVIWTPAAEEDRMSSVELETLYPEMKKLRDATSTAGRTFCDHCGGLFPAELQACPHCGAKVSQVA